jgi:hypothetical protein
MSTKSDMLKPQVQLILRQILSWLWTWENKQIACFQTHWWDRNSIDIPTPKRKKKKQEKLGNRHQVNSKPKKKKKRKQSSGLRIIFCYLSHLHIPWGWGWTPKVPYDPPFVASLESHIGASIILGVLRQLHCHSTTGHCPTGGFLLWSYSQGGSLPRPWGSLRHPVKSRWRYSPVPTAPVPCIPVKLASHECH